MSLSDGFLRKVLLAIALSASATLAGCTMAPVYADRGSNTANYQLAYAEPASRLEQIVYQELSLRFDRAQTPDAALLKVSIGTSGRVLARAATAAPAKDYMMTATGNVTLTRGGKVLFQGTRTASASYTVRDQALTDRAAESAAAEQASRALAETIRLTVIAALANTP